MERVNAIVLAGDSSKEVLQDYTENKSFLIIRNKLMVEYVVDALNNCPLVGSISIVGPVQKLKERLGNKIHHYIEDRGDIFGNLQAGIQPFMGQSGVLMVTSDIPMINKEVISDFINRCWEKQVEFCYSIVAKEVNDSKYPGFQRTYIKMRDGIFTGGNMFYFHPDIIEPCTEFAKKMVFNRKNPWKLGRILGFKFLVLLAMGRLSIHKVETRFHDLLGIKAAAIISPFPELANDVDKPSDLEYINFYMK